MTIDFSKIWLGMENDWYMKNSDTSYPRYNIVENTVAGSFRLEIAVPGWQQEELELIQDKTELLVRGKKEQKLSQEEQFVHQGLSLKSFERKFIINADIQVDDVELANGLLTIALSRTPNSTRKILAINSGNNSN